MTIHAAFKSYSATAEETEAMSRIAEAYSALLNVIEGEIPPSRERSVAVTELQTSAFWATRALFVRNGERT